MKIIFDLSDVVKYAIGNSSVSGIQRVQLKIISEYAKTKRAGEDVWISYFDEDEKKFFHVRPDELLRGEGFDSELMLGRLGKIRRRFFPEKFRIKRYLKRFEENKLRRGWGKVAIYFMAFFGRGVLRDAGLLPEPGSTEIREISKIPMECLHKNDIFVLLGSFWDYEQVLQRSEAHKLAGGRVFALIHDLIPVVVPHLSTAGLNKIFEAFVPRLNSVATQLMAVSENTASDLAKVLALGASNSMVKVLPLAHEFSGYSRNTIDEIHLPSNLLDASYVLCVGTIEIRKNGLLLLKAWKRLVAEGGAVPHLVFAGKYGWRVSAFKDFLSREIHLSSFVHIINSPNDDCLASLYTNAEFCVFPSLYEGWGLPVGEAAWFGNYVIASSASSVPEVCGPNVMDYVSPMDEDAWFTILHRVINDPAYLMRKKEEIRHMRCREWRDVAENLRSILVA